MHNSYIHVRVHFTIHLLYLHNTQQVPYLALNPVCADPRITTSVARRVLTSNTNQGGSLSVTDLPVPPLTQQPIPPPTLKRDLVHKMKTLRSQLNAIQPPGHCRIEVGTLAVCKAVGRIHM